MLSGRSHSSEKSADSSRQIEELRAELQSAQARGDVAQQEAASVRAEQVAQRNHHAVKQILAEESHTAAELLAEVSVAQYERAESESELLKEERAVMHQNLVLSKKTNRI